MGRVKQTAKRSHFAIAEEQQERDIAENNVNTKTENVEMSAHSGLDNSAELDAQRPDLEQESKYDAELDTYMDMGYDEEFQPGNDTQQDAPVLESDFEYNDDQVDGDFEDDPDGDSDYDDPSCKRRRRTAKSAIPSKSARPKPKRSQGTLSSATVMPRTPRSRANSAAQTPRALRKAHRDVESKLSKGQPDAEGDRALRCLPYRTLNRAPKRELIRWNDDTYIQTLLTMSWVLEVHDIEIPWDEIAAVVHPGATGEAFKQALTKLRARRFKEGLPVPPIRPGKEKSRKECAEELGQLVAMAQMVRNRNLGESKITSKGGPVNDEDDEIEETDREDEVPTARKQPPRCDEGDDSDERLSSTDMSLSSGPSPTPPPKENRIQNPIHDITTDSVRSVTLQVVTGNVSDLHARPSPSVASLQNRTNGLDTDMDIPGFSPNRVGPTGLDSITEEDEPPESARPMGPPRRPSDLTQNRHRSNSTTNRGRAQKLPPATPPSQKAALMQNLPFAPSTPPTLLRTPTECPPAPRTSSHSRKRSVDVLGVPEASPTSKRRTPSVPRRPSLSQIPEYDPYSMSPSNATPNLYGNAHNGSIGESGMENLPMGGMMFPPYHHGNMQMGNMNMGNMPFQQAPFMPNMMQQSYLHGIGMQHNPFTNNVPPAPWQQVNPLLQQAQLRQRANSQPNDTHPNPLIMRNLTPRDFASDAANNVTSPRASQAPPALGLNHPFPASASAATAGRNQQHPSFLDQDDDLTDMAITPFTIGGDFFTNQWSRDTDTNPVPFQNLDLGHRASEAEEVKPFGSGSEQQQTGGGDSQNTSSFGGGPSTQDSFGSNIQGSHVTPSQPRAGPSTGGAAMDME